MGIDGDHTLKDSIMPAYLCRAPCRLLCVALCLSLGFSVTASAGDVPMPTGIECVRDCPGAKPVTKRSSRISSGDVGSAFVGALFGAILGAALTPDQDDEAETRRRQEEAAALAARQLAEQRIRAIAAQAAYDRMMQSYKQLEGAAAVDFKSLGGQNIGFKSLDGDAEAMATNSRMPFDTAASSVALPALETNSQPTPFFGDTMPMAQLRLLVEPSNDPRVVDLRKAKKFTIESLKMQQDRPDQGQPAWTGPDATECRAMDTKLRGFIDQQNKFHQTILLANEQVEIWEEANRNALINAAKEGIERFGAVYMENLNKRGAAAERLMGAFNRNKARMLAEGVDVMAVERKIARLKTTSKASKLTGVISDANDWQTFMKDGMSSVLKQLNASNAEILNDPVMQRYFTTEMPEVQTLLDLTQMGASAKVFGKWVAKQMPMVAWTSFAINQTYNATDWLLSFQRLVDAHQINGKVAGAAKSIQRKIDDTRIALKQCS